MRIYSYVIHVFFATDVLDIPETIDYMPIDYDFEAMRDLRFVIVADTKLIKQN